jgi:methylenetetrahydrofolate reductase (NADPH)
VTGKDQPSPRLGVEGDRPTAAFEVLPTFSTGGKDFNLGPRASITITASPRGTIEQTLAAARRLKQEGYHVVPHIAARLVTDRPHLRSIVSELQAASIDEIFVVGGDAREPVGSYATAGQLLADLSQYSPAFASIGIAGYPLGHPSANDAALLAALLHKEQYAGYVVTQICLEANRLVDWILKLREHGFALPVRVGVPGAVSRRKLVEIAGRLQLREVVSYLGKNRGFASAVLRRADFSPGPLLDDLDSHPEFGALGITGVHFFTFNQLANTAAFWAERSAGPALGSGRLRIGG